MSATRQDVIWAYRVILGREPKGEKEIEKDLAVGDLGELASALLNSSEFRLRYERKIKPDAMLVFIHIPKTAGTSVRIFLDQAFSGKLLWHGKAGGLAAKSANIFWHYQKFGETYLNCFDAIGGHFDYSEIKPLLDVKGGKKIVTAILRDPLERVLSHYEFIRNQPGHPQYREVVDCTLYEALKKKRIFYHLSHCAQLRNLTGCSKFRRSLKVLNGNSYMVGNLDYIDKWKIAIQERFRLKEMDFVSANNSIKNYKEKITSQDDFGLAERLIRNINSDEYRLIDYVGELYENEVVGSGRVIDMGMAHAVIRRIISPTIVLNSSHVGLR